MSDESISTIPAVTGSLESGNDHVEVSVTGYVAMSDKTMLTIMEENRELWRRLRLLRDAMRLTDWLLLQDEYPEMKAWFDD